MLYYDIYYLKISTKFSWFVLLQSLQNSQTLRQFFNPLYGSVIDQIFHTFILSAPTSLLMLYPTCSQSSNLTTSLGAFLAMLEMPKVTSFGSQTLTAPAVPSKSAVMLSSMTFPHTSPSPVISNSYLPLLEDIYFENRLQPMTHNTPCVVSHEHVIKHNPEHCISDSESGPEHISNHRHGALNSHPHILKQALENEHPAPPLPHTLHHDMYPPIVCLICKCHHHPVSYFCRKVPELPTPHPSVSHPKQTSKLPSKYLNYIDSQSIVNQLLQLDDEEACIPLPNNLLMLPHIVSDITTANSV